MIPLLINFIDVAADKGGSIAEGAKHLFSDRAEESSYFVARILMKAVYWILDLFGLENDDTIFVLIYTLVVFFVSILVGIIVKWLLVKALDAIGPHIDSIVYKNLVKSHFFSKTCRIVPALVFLILIQFTLSSHVSLSSWLTRFCLIYIVLILCSSICKLTDAIWQRFDAKENKKNLPLNGLVQLVKLIVWVIGAIVIVSILLDKSPAKLLVGLGAFATVLMLVFKDSILGVVAGVQLAQNESLHVGDWIVPNGSDANGTVVEVGLTAVKIENWDKTISTIPPYNLISSGFRNYRNMQLSNTRRIQRSYMIDADSVVEADDAMLEEFSSIPYMKEWIAAKVAQKKAGKIENVSNSQGLADGTIDNNLGMFRAYLKMYLSNNPDISHEDTCFISTLPQTAGGIPLQIYCFTSTSSWIPYEGIMSGVFEHLAVMLYRFHLYTFENPSGRDTIIDGYLSPGKTPETMFGLPYPFFLHSGSPMNPGMPPQWLYPGASLYAGMNPTDYSSGTQNNPQTEPAASSVRKSSAGNPS